MSQCAVCNGNKNSNPREPLLPGTLPGRPWEKIGTDLFHYNGAEYLLCVDYCTKYPEITKLSDMTSQGVITVITEVDIRKTWQYASGGFRVFFLKAVNFNMLLPVQGTLSVMEGRENFTNHKELAEEGTEQQWCPIQCLNTITQKLRV